MPISDIEAELNAKFAAAPPIGAILAVDLGAYGALKIDGTGKSNVVSHGAEGAACTIKVSADDLRQIIGGELNPTSAFMSGKLSIDGDLGIAMSLASALG
jgi:putative sterol carrier protein